MMENKENQAIIEMFSRTADSYFSLPSFMEKLNSGKPLSIKYGVDVTAPFLHLGHAVNLWMMRSLQDLGHKVIFLIGDFTTGIGDPTGKSNTRPVISQEEIERNANQFIKQVSIVLNTSDPNVFSIRRNSEWYNTMNTRDFLGLLSFVTHNRLISRDMFQKRIHSQKDIYMHEMIYPILQGYDSYMLESDVTIVGSDQLFNEMMGKFYQEKHGQSPQAIITTRITPGLDGVHKQSKSLNNYIALADSSKDMFGKAMSMPDQQIIEWMEVYTDISMENIMGYRKGLEQGSNPRDIKMELACSLVEKYYGKEESAHQKKYFLETFSKQNFPADCDVLNMAEGDYNIIEILQKLDNKPSRSHYRRLLNQGGIKINARKITSHEEIILVRKGIDLQCKIGKKKFYKIVSE